MTLDQIFTVFIISTIVSVFSYFFWNKNIDKLIQAKLYLLKQEILKNGEMINRKLRKIEMDLQKNRFRESTEYTPNKKRKAQINVSRDN